MGTMSVPKTGDRVVVAPRGVEGNVFSVTQFVVGEGRYVGVKFEDGSSVLVHESLVSLPCKVDTLVVPLNNDQIASI